MKKLINQNDIEDREEDYLEKITYLAEEKVKSLSDVEKMTWKQSISLFFLTDDIKKKIRQEIEQKLIKLDILTILMSGLGLVTNGLQSLFYLKFKIIKTTYNNDKEDTFTIDVSGEPSNITEIFRFITSFSTVIVIILLIFHYNIKKNLLIFKQQVPFNSSLWSTGLLIPLIVEILLNLLHTPPYLNNITIKLSTTDTESIEVPIDLDLFLSVFITFRAYLIFKFYANYSKWSDVRAIRVCKECNAEGGFKFTCKAELKENPYFVLSILLIISILIFGYCLRNTEITFIIDVPLSNFQDWTHMWNGFWCITMTIITVGYGDYYPRTHLGRIITLIACLWGTFLESLIIVAITNTMDLDSNELAAFNEIKKLILEKKHKKNALNLIKNLNEVKKLELDQSYSESDKDIKHKQEIAYNKALKKTQKSLDEFRKTKKEVNDIEKATSIETVVKKINISLNEDMDSVVRQSENQIVAILNHLNYSKYFQNIIKAYTKILEQMTYKLYKTIPEQTEDKKSKRNKEENETYESQLRINDEKKILEYNTYLNSIGKININNNIENDKNNDINYNNFDSNNLNLVEKEQNNINSSINILNDINEVNNETNQNIKINNMEDFSSNEGVVILKPISQNKKVFKKK